MIKVYERILSEGIKEIGLKKVCEIMEGSNFNIPDHILFKQKRYKVMRLEFNAESYEKKLIVDKVADNFYLSVEEVKECKFCHSKICTCT